MHSSGRNYTVLSITGSLPPEPCGVGDFSACLAKEINEIRNSEFHVILSPRFDWKLRYAHRIIYYIIKLNPDIIHIQYPTAGYNASIVPQLLCVFFRRSVVTVHEFSRVHFLRKVATLFFIVFAKKIIFTSGFEASIAANFYKYIKFDYEVIPIGNNIPKYTINIPKKNDTIVSFGLIRPDKGIEDVIHLARLILNDGLSYKIRIIGKLIDKHQEYANKMIESACGLPVEWVINSNEAQVSTLLAESKYAYLPFPDGISERRGSLLAVFANSVIVLSTNGEYSTKELLESVIVCENPRDCLKKLLSINQNATESLRLINAGIAYLDGRSWSNIKLRHIHLYEQIMHRI